MDAEKRKIEWPHAPPHWLTESGIYIVTAGTHYKQKFFTDAARLAHLHNSLLEEAASFGWQLQAWAVFPNHYHFVAETNNPGNLPVWIGKLHSGTARAVNKADGAPGRKVWHQYWDTQITNQRSWIARMAYVNLNAVKHGIVKRAIDYPYCSARWIEQKSGKPFAETLEAVKIDRVSVIDEY